MNIFLIGIVIVLTIICVCLEIKSPRCSRGEVCRMIVCGILGTMLLSGQAWCETIGKICIIPYTILSLFGLWPRIFDR